jgi:hypothetical protein
LAEYVDGSALRRRYVEALAAGSPRPVRRLPAAQLRGRRRASFSHHIR